jgi:hypothetical protein
MATTKTELICKVRRRLGEPMIKVELDDVQISDHVDYSRQKWIKWAVGNATQEYYFTLPLSAGQILYDMPPGLTTMVGYDTGFGTTGGGINTLFTVENYMWNMGMFGHLQYGGDSWSLVSYHLARDFLDTLDRYIVDTYNFHYHKYTNQLEINPVPDFTSEPQYILIRAYFVENATPWSTGSVDLGYSTDLTEQDLYGEGWIVDYVTALSKISLGYIRNKFANFASLGNVGITLDGDTMLSEGKEEKAQLEEELRLEEGWEGYGIEIG